MREIKFRGSVAGRNMWEYFVASDYNKGEWYRFWEIVDLKTVGEWTGKHDKNGKEIYEDDIVAWHGGQYTITFSQIVGAWILKDDREDWECPSLYGVSSPEQSRLQVIDNIHGW